jgi:hypothetical protein
MLAPGALTRIPVSYADRSSLPAVDRAVRNAPEMRLRAKQNRLRWGQSRFEFDGPFAHLINRSGGRERCAATSQAAGRIGDSHPRRAQSIPNSSSGGYAAVLAGGALTAFLSGDLSQLLLSEPGVFGRGGRHARPLPTRRLSRLGPAFTSAVSSAGRSPTRNWTSTAPINSSPRPAPALRRS